MWRQDLQEERCQEVGAEHSDERSNSLPIAKHQKEKFCLLETKLMVWDTSKPNIVFEHISTRSADPTSYQVEEKITEKKVKKNKSEEKIKFSVTN